MADTQWTRYQVFLQEREGEPYQDVGSVHAPDAELALCNARDVFVRRPACSGLWLVPARAIFSKTEEELGMGGTALKNDGASKLKTDKKEEKDQEEPYSVFCKLKPAGTCTYTGEVQAGSPAKAMATAIAALSPPGHPSVWWVVPNSRIMRSEPEQEDSLFSPAFEKTFRLSTDFRTVSAMRSIRNTESQGNNP